MKAFCKVSNRQNEINAAWYLFQLFVTKSKMLRGRDAEHIVVGKDSKARSLGSCTYYYDKGTSSVTLSPSTIVDLRRIEDQMDLFYQVAHTAVHEVCHGIIQKKYFNASLMKITVYPHGREWEWTMREFGIFDGAAKGGRGFPMLFKETQFLSDALELFEGWRRGEFNLDLYQLCLQSKV